MWDRWRSVPLGAEPEGAPLRGLQGPLQPEQRGAHAAPGPRRQRSLWFRQASPSPLCACGALRFCGGRSGTGSWSAGTKRTPHVSLVSREQRGVDGNEAQAPSALTKGKNTSMTPLPGANPGEPPAAVYMTAAAWLLWLHVDSGPHGIPHLGTVFV